MEKAFSFGSVEEYLREEIYPSVPDKIIDLGEDVMYVSGICVYLPRLNITIHEGFICDKKIKKSAPKYFVTAILDRESRELLYDAETDFLECVYLWLKEKIPVAELGREKCLVEGIEVKEDGKSIQAGHGGRNY